MRPAPRLIVALAVVFLVRGGSAARAQYYYPPGYSSFGWNGWGGGGGGGGSTVQGNVAQGLGAFAAGAGVYNQQTAVATAINANTAMQWNEYLWQSQQEANRRYHQKLARQRTGNTKAREDVYRRLRDAPEPADIARGDALNVALDEVSNPKVYLRKLKAAGTKVAGTMIRDIPFQHASAAITTSVDQLTKGGPPEALKAEAFAADRAELRGLAAELRSQNEQQGKYDPDTLHKAQGVIHRVRVKVETTIPKGTRRRTEAEKYLKALFGLTRLLESPAVDVLLAGVEKRPDTTLGDLLTFMSAFNLRFGVANTPRQKEVYKEIYPLLVQLRAEAETAAAAAGTETETAPAAAEPGGGEVRPAEFFAGMPIEQLDPGDPKVAPPPRPGVK